MRDASQGEDFSLENQRSGDEVLGQSGGDRQLYGMTRMC